MLKKALFLAVVIACMFGCASFQPRSGMTYGEFNHMSRKSFNGRPLIVGMNGTIYVYYLRGDKNLFYWFENDKLTRIEQGQLPQIRCQIEHIQK